MNFFSIITIVLVNIVFGSKWLPDLSFSPDFNQFQYYPWKSAETIYPSMNGELPKDFEWQTITSVTLPSKNVSFISYGGSQQISRDIKSPFNRQLSTVILCELKWNRDSSRLEKTMCSVQQSDRNNRYLGAAVRAISVSDDEAVLVYCDPLWHVDDPKEPKPSGKCYLMSLGDRDNPQKNTIEFCKLSSTTYSSCMGGFSVDLANLNNEISGIQMIVGLPVMVPFGGVKIINNPLSSSTGDELTSSGKYYNYGYSVALTSTGGAYVSSPLSDSYGPNVTDIRSDVRVTSPDNNPFSSFGVTLTTLSVYQGKKQALVIGAPYHTVGTIANVGKTYVFCSTNTDQRLLSSIIHGKVKDEFLGYALANIGDINGDGNDDLAISSPFLRDNNLSGYISIYTTDDNCKLSRQPIQILKTQQAKDEGIFGISISGGSDMDFNNWPDIVVANSRSNIIELFASRQILTAKCVFTIPKNFETQPLTKDDNITVTISLSLLDTKRNHFIDMEVFKNFKIVSQVDPNVNASVDRFKLNSKSIKIDFFGRTSVHIQFSIKSLSHVKEMKLTTPVIVAYRFVEDCTNGSCNNLLFPLINWEKCTAPVPIKKYVCSNYPNCDADIAVEIIDVDGNEISFGNNKMYHRNVEIRIFNFGPTEAKDINFNVTTYQNLKISRFTFAETFLHQISNDSMHASVKLDQLEIENQVSATIINVELYVNEKDNLQSMKYENNSLVVELYSDVTDSNHTNNIGRIDYKFVYEPNISFSGFVKKDTIVDHRNHTQPFRRGQRITTDKIGPHLSQTFTIDNIGMAIIYNFSIKISLPIHTKDNLDILYLFDKIRGVNKSQVAWMSIVPHVTVGSNKYPCSLPMNYVNPLKIKGFESDALHLADIEKTQIEGSLHVLRKRSAENDGEMKDSEKNIKMSQGKMHRVPVEIIQCNRPGVNLHSPVCGDIICEIPPLAPNKQARIQINAWLVAHTFFKKQIADIMVYTTLTAEFRKLPPGIEFRSPKQKTFSQIQQFLFANVKQKIVHIKQTWPIIVGIVIGTLILAILIVAMYKCGFFKRSKRRRRFKSKKLKKHEPVITHQFETASSTRSETKFTSHSTLINSKDKTAFD